MKQSPSKYLRSHPLCVVCMSYGYYRKSKHVIWHDRENNVGLALCDEHYIHKAVNQDE